MPTCICISAHVRQNHILTWLWASQSASDIPLAPISTDQRQHSAQLLKLPLWHLTQIDPNNWPSGLWPVNKIIGITQQKKRIKSPCLSQTNIGTLSPVSACRRDLCSLSLSCSLYTQNNTTQKSYCVRLKVDILVRLLSLLLLCY